MNLQELLNTILKDDAEVEKQLKVYEENGYITTPIEETQNALLEALEDNGFYVYDTQFIDGFYRLYIEL